MTAATEEDKLVAFFRQEGFVLGHQGDFEGWTPAETAIHAMRELLALRSNPAGVRVKGRADLLVQLARIIARNVDDERFYDAPGFQRAANEILSALEPQQEEAVAFIDPSDLDRLKSGESIVFYAQDREKIGIPLYAGAHPTQQPVEAEGVEVTDEVVERALESKLREVNLPVYGEHKGDWRPLRPKEVAAALIAALSRKDGQNG